MPSIAVWFWALVIIPGSNDGRTSSKLARLDEELPAFRLGGGGRGGTMEPDDFREGSLTDPSAERRRVGPSRAPFSCGSGIPPDASWSEGCLCLP
jgi:hypothetical protein